MHGRQGEGGLRLRPGRDGAGGLRAVKSIPQGAATQVYVATHPTLAAVTGRYFADCNLAPTRPDVTDVLARRLWDVSETIVAGLPAGG